MRAQGSKVPSAAVVEAVLETREPFFVAFEGARCKAGEFPALCPPSRAPCN